MLGCMLELDACTIEQECRLGMSDEMPPLEADSGIQDIARIAACMFSEG